MRNAVKPIEQHPKNRKGGKIANAKDAFFAIDKALGDYRVGETFTVEDGFIGIDVRLTVYNDPGALRTSQPVTGRLDDDLEPADSNYPPETRAVCLYLITRRFLASDAPRMPTLSVTFSLAALPYASWITVTTCVPTFPIWIGRCKV